MNRTDDPWGDPSTARVLALMGGAVGCAVAVGGLVLIAIGKPEGAGVVGIGAGMFTGGGLTLAWHRNAEAKVEVAEATAPAAVKEASP